MAMERQAEDYCSIRPKTPLAPSFFFLSSHNLSSCMRVRIAHAFIPTAATMMRAIDGWMHRSIKAKFIRRLEERTVCSATPLLPV